MTGAVRALALAAALGLAAAPPVCAEPAMPSADAPRPLPDRARAVLETHCADCREGSAEGEALDLDALADDPRRVMPGRPDASRIYQRLLAAQEAAEGDASPPVPTPAEIETVRDWIESLPTRDSACRERTFVSNSDVAALIAAWSKGRSAADKADTRFLSLVHLWNACVSRERLEAYRDATTALLAALARSRAPLEFATLGEQHAVLVVPLSRLALVPAQWVRLMETAPRLASADAAPADWLAARILAHGRGETEIDPAFAVAFDAASQRAVERLARAWVRDVDLVRAAAERGVAPRKLAATLANVGGEFLHSARRLGHGALSRAEWQGLSRALDGEAPPGSAERRAPVSDAEIDVLLWADKPVYRPRDLVTFNVSVGKACHLTLIDVDSSGKAIVLFPNELEQDNLVAPWVTVRVPGRDAGYQFRFDASGEEQIVAICQRKSRRPDGIAYDYERQRFAILGDWRTFLRTIPEREKKIRDREAAEAARRKRRNRQPVDNGPPAIGVGDPVAIEGRAAIAVTIDPGKT